MPPASANLRNSLYFPSFKAIPNEHELNEEYYAMVRPGVFDAHSHWCLFAEIESISPWPVRLVLNVCDREGQKFLVSFNTDDEGQSLKPQAKPGHVIAVLYAEHHDFMSGHSGLRVEDSTTVRILPFSLGTLKKANDLVFNDIHDAACAECGTSKTEKTLLKCSQCKIVHYCSQECQVTAWKETHKVECKGVKALEWFHTKEWNKRRGAVDFFSF